MAEKRISAVSDTTHPEQHKMPWSLWIHRAWLENEPTVPGLRTWRCLVCVLHRRRRRTCPAGSTPGRWIAAAAYWPQRNPRRSRQSHGRQTGERNASEPCSQGWPWCAICRSVLVHTAGERRATQVFPAGLSTLQLGGRTWTLRNGTQGLVSQLWVYKGDRTLWKAHFSSNVSPVPWGQYQHELLYTYSISIRRWIMRCQGAWTKRSVRIYYATSATVNNYFLFQLGRFTANRSPLQINFFLSSFLSFFLFFFLPFLRSSFYFPPFFLSFFLPFFLSYVLSLVRCFYLKLFLSSFLFLLIHALQHSGSSARLFLEIQRFMPEWSTTQQAWWGICHVNAAWRRSKDLRLVFRLGQ